MTSPNNAIASKSIATAALAAALAVALPAPADAMDARGRYTVYGSGELECGSWTREQKLASSLALKDQAWVLGYITAYNRWVSEERSVLGERKSGEVIDWIDAFCQANPRETLNGAVESLIFEIKAGG